MGPLKKGPEEEAWVEVGRTTDRSLLAVWRSLLEDRGIPSVTRGEAGLDLFPLGDFGGGFLRRSFEAILLVPPDRRREASTLLTLQEPVGR